MATANTLAGARQTGAISESRSVTGRVFLRQHGDKVAHIPWQRTLELHEFAGLRVREAQCARVQCLTPETAQ